MGLFKKKDAAGKMSKGAYVKAAAELQELLRQSTEEARAQLQRTYEKLRNGDKETAFLLAQLNLLLSEMVGRTVGAEAWQAVLELHDERSTLSRFYLNYLYLNYMILHLGNHDKPRLTKESLSEIEENESVLSLSKRYKPATMLEDDLDKLYLYVFYPPENKYGIYGISADQMMRTTPKIF